MADLFAQFRDLVSIVVGVAGAVTVLSRFIVALGGQATHTAHRHGHGALDAVLPTAAVTLMVLHFHHLLRRHVLSMQFELCERELRHHSALRRRGSPTALDHLNAVRLVLQTTQNTNRHSLLQNPDAHGTSRNGYRLTKDEESF